MSVQGPFVPMDVFNIAADVIECNRRGLASSISRGEVGTFANDYTAARILECQIREMDRALRC